MITQLRKKLFSKKLANGGAVGINNLPVPYDRAPLFSKKGLSQAAHTAGQQFNRLPGFIKKPIKLFNPITKNPWVLGGYGLSGAYSLYQNRNKPDPNMKETSLQELGISPLADAQKSVSEFDQMMAQSEQVVPNIEQGQLPAEMIDVYEKVSQYAIDNQIPYEVAYSILVHGKKPEKAGLSLKEAFPGMSNSEIIDSMNKSENNSGIEIAPNAKTEVIENALENNQMETPPEPEGPIIDNEQELVDTTQSTLADGETIDTTSAVVAEEVEKRDVQNKNASQLYWDSMFPQVLKSGRSDQALKLDKTVYDIMGPESKKSKNLLLLQLAANLMSNTTDQPGFKGFIDVLGQAGQQVIPMAMALEAERRDDEMELKKALINAQNKEVNFNKLGEIKGIAEYNTPGGKKRGPYRYDEYGEVIVTQTDSDGLNPVMLNITGKVIRTMPFPDPKQIIDFNREIGMYSRALKGVNTVLDIATADPSLIGTVGTVKRFGARAADILAQATGQLDFDELRQQLSDTEEHFFANIERNKSTYSEDDFEELLETGNDLFGKLRKDLGKMGGEGTLQQQAKIRAVQLMTSYALANILKNKDRLAVQDIKRAERLTESFGLLNSPTDIVYAYVELKNQLESAISEKVLAAKTIGIDETQIAALQYQLMGPKEKREQLSGRIDKVLDGIQELEGKEGLDKLLDNIFKGIDPLEPIPQNFEFNVLGTGTPQN